MSAFGRLAFDDLPAAVPTPTVFIASSFETLNVAHAVQSKIELRTKAECTVWTDGVFAPTSNFLSALLEKAKRVDFAVVVAAQDDVTVRRKDTFAVPRDNVTFELGLFMGVLGRERTFIVCPENAPRLPSDLDGTTQLRYRERQDGNLEAAVSAGVERIVTTINKLGVRDQWPQLMAGFDL